MRAQTVLSMAVVAGLGAWLVESPVVKAAPKSSQVTVANMHIDPGSGQYNLLPDTTGSTYVDYRVPGGDACAQGEIYPSGLASLILNRPMPDGRGALTAPSTRRADSASCSVTTAHAGS